MVPLAVTVPLKLAIATSHTVIGPVRLKRCVAVFIA